MSEISLTQFKRCNKCGCTKPATTSFFNAGKGHILGLRAQCKVCRALRKREDRERPGAKAQAAAYRARNAARKASYRAANKEQIAEIQRRWAEANRQKVYQAVKRWRKKNPEKRKESNRNCQSRRRARRLGAEGSHTLNEVLQMYDSQDGLCAYCETPLFGTYHVDHMLPISRDGRDDWQNLAVTCPTCNRVKHDKTTLEFAAVLGYSVI